MLRMNKIKWESKKGKKEGKRWEREGKRDMARKRGSETNKDNQNRKYEEEYEEEKRIWKRKSKKVREGCYKRPTEKNYEMKKERIRMRDRTNRIKKDLWKLETEEGRNKTGERGWGRESERDKYRVSEMRIEIERWGEDYKSGAAQHRTKLKWKPYRLHITSKLVCSFHQASFGEEKDRRSDPTTGRQLVCYAASDRASNSWKNFEPGCCWLVDC